MAAEAGRRILVFGASGQVGRALQRELSGAYPLVALTRADADFSEPESLRNAVRRHRPAAIVIAAAYTAVDRAESDSETARLINVLAPQVIASEARAADACVVQYSTDYVFDGAKSEPYAENDRPNPLSVYGATKLEGERVVAEANPRHITLRTSWVFDAQGANFLTTMVRRAAQGPELAVVNDQFGAPTSAELVAQGTSTVLREMLDAPARDPRWGTYHLTASGSTSWHNYARRIVTKARALGIPLMATPDAVAPISTAQFGAAAARPQNSRLNTDRIRRTFGVTLPDWTVGVDAVLEQLSVAWQ